MEEKNIRTLLTSKRVVPEIQREYVWGNNEKIVTEFLTTLNNNVPGKANIGFLYDYNSDDEFHLIDGQQRLTTIILLCLYCARKEGNNSSYKEILCNFSYRVRTTTDEFLQELIKTGNQTFSSEGIKSMRFYHEFLKKDKSVESIIKSLNVIDEFCKKNEFKITYEWIMQNVAFWTFDVTQTSQGEELYISMNSRGADLTMSEQIKPLLLNASKGTLSTKGNLWGKEWDNWEDSFFCICKDVNGVDLAMERLILATLDLFTGKPHGEIKPQEAAKEISLFDLEKVHTAYTKLYNSQDQWMKWSFYEPQKDDKCLKSLFELEGYNRRLVEVLIASCVAGHDETEFSRVEHTVRNWEQLSLIENEKFIKLINGYVTSGQNFYKFIVANYSTEETYNDIYKNHELLKIKIYELPEIGSIAESLFWEADMLNATRGYIRSIWQEAFIDDFEWNNERLDTFRTRLEIFKSVFADENTKRDTSIIYDSGIIDSKLITRALLALNKGSYHIWGSGQNYAFGHYGSWANILKTDRGYVLVSNLIDKIFENKSENIYNSLMKIVDEGKKTFEKNDVRYYILNYPHALCAESVGYNNISMDDSNSWTNFGLYVLDKVNAHSNYIQMFCSMVYEGIKSEFTSADKWLNLSEKKIQLRCSSIGGWDLHYNEDYVGNIEHLKSILIDNFGKERIIDNEDTKKNRNFYVSLCEDDQVELGIKIYRILQNESY